MSAPLYSSGGIFGKRIIVLGDSHYCGTPCGKCGVKPNPKCNRLTSDVIGWCLNPKIEREGWMNTYQPDLLIVWDKRLWGNLPNVNWIDGSEVQVDGYLVENGYYRLDNVKKVRAICVYHPSVGYSWDFW